MKLKSYSVVLSVVAAAFFVISCSSTPPVEEEPQVEPVVVIEDIVIIEEPQETVLVEEFDYDGLGRLIAEAKDKQQEIIKYQITADGNENLALADEALNQAEVIYNMGEDGSAYSEKLAAQENVVSARDSYNEILNSYWFGKANDARERAGTARQEALKLKADVAVAQDYKNSADVFNSGEEAFTAKDYQLSVNYYIQAESLFASVAITAAEKKRLAGVALQSAEKKIEESEKIATDAEAELNGDEL
ncbi:MAG: hypothetical protein LBV68_07085 [Spirochaetaceae bacterium]|jgi:hypothetical protein|nr:hypothetical protein [Spirochaetaceae bacterium]